MPILQGLLIGTICSLRKNEDAETPPFLKLLLEKEHWTVYNQWEFAIRRDLQ